MATATKLLSYEEWLDLPENDEGREECINGVIEKMPTAKWRHTVVADRLTKQLWRKLDEGATFVVGSDFGLIIRTNAGLIERDGYIHSAPELAVEVLSPANTPKRIREKLDDYASIAIPEAWVMDPDARTITLHRLENGNYQSGRLTCDGVTTPVQFPSITVDFSSIWQ